MTKNPVERRAEITTALFVFFAACMAYAAALTGTFVYDDIHSVASNEGVQSLSNLLRFFVDPTLFSSAGNVMYRPVLLCTFAVDHALGAGSPVPFKLTNVLLHAATATLLFGWLRHAGAARTSAALAAAFFAVHPLASEAVNMVSARSELLSTLGLTVALRSQQEWRAGRGGFALGVVLGAVLACGSKETGALLPVLLMAQEWVFARPRSRDAWRSWIVRMVPAVLVVGCYLVVRKALLGHATAVLLGRTGSDPMYGSTRDLLTQLCTMAAALPGVLMQAIWPVGLTLDPAVVYYRDPWAGPVLLGALSLVLLTALGMRRMHERPIAAFGVVVAWTIALPWIVIPLNLPLSEHRCYGPLLGLSMLAAPQLERWLQRLPVGAARLLPAVPLIACMVCASVRSLDYGSESTIWASALRQNPHSFRANWGYGAARQQLGLYAEAEPYLARSVAIYPAFRTARRSWVECMLQMPAQDGWPFRALIAAEELTRQKDDDPYYRILHANALLQCGIASGDRGYLERAEEQALSCLAIAPPKALVYRVAARCRQELADLPGALAHYDAALQRQLDFPSLRVERADVLRAMGRAQEADRELKAAFARAPMDQSVRAAFERRYASPPR